MTRLAVIFCLLLTLPVFAGVRLPSAEEEAAFGSWSATAMALNAAHASTNIPGWEKLLYDDNGFLHYPIGSNKVAYGSHIGRASRLRYVCDSTISYYTTGTGEYQDVDSGYATLQSNTFPRWSSVYTNQAAPGDVLLTWGNGIGFDPTGTPTGSGASRRYPVSGNKAVRWIRHTIGSVSAGIYISSPVIGTNTDGVITGEDSSGPSLRYNSASNRWDFVATSYYSFAGTIQAGFVVGGQQQGVSATYSRAGTLAALLGDDVNGSPVSPPPPDPPVKYLNTQTFIIGTPP